MGWQKILQNGKNNIFYIFSAYFMNFFLLFQLGPYPRAVSSNKLPYIPLQSGI